MNEIAIAVEAIKNAVLRSQYQAAKDVNRVQLALYFGVGRFLFSKKGKRTWGTKVLESISTKLRNELPGLRGFSAENLKKMRQFYENWQFLDSSDLTNTIQKLPVRRNSVVATTELEKAVVIIPEFIINAPDFPHTKLWRICRKKCRK